MSEKLSKSERTRQFIIEKTAPVFNEKGFAGTSVTDLTKATGLTKGSIYGNFADKDAVAVAAFDFNFNRVTEYMKARILAKDNAVDRLLAYPAVYRDFLRIPFLKPGCPILNTSTEADDTHPLLKEKAASALAFWKKSIENQVMRGISRGEIRKDVSPATVAVIMMSMIEGAIMQAKVTGRATELRIAMDFLASWIEGLRK
ncbi:MAG: TetR/AcrR family transcriptional regulator [Sphingobacteriales bacterium]|nr:TetR/AcrR family transcriptional regulator [Sphingobacteriales bacterium]